MFGILCRQRCRGIHRRPRGGETDASLLSGNTLPVAMLCVLLFDRQLAQAQEVGAHNNKNTLLNHEPIHEGQQQQQ